VTGVELERVHPLHAVVRIAQRDAHRRLAHDRHCRLVSGYGDASECIEEVVHEIIVVFTLNWYGSVRVIFVPKPAIHKQEAD